MAALSLRSAAAVAAVAALSALGLPAAAAESAYTDFDADACTVLSRQEEGGSIELRCPGLAGVPVFYSEGDGRADMDFGAPDGEFSSFSFFNTVGAKIEWRLAEGRPHAAIVRYTLDSGLGDGKALGDVLLVAKVGTKAAPGCPVAVVDVSTVEQPNGVARGVAALAPRFDCRTDQPIAIGGRKSVAADFAPAVPEGR